jgi:multiple sugar transport system permease protein
VIVYPLMSGVVLSFFDIYTPSLSGPYVGLANYNEILFQAEFWVSLRNNFIWTFGTLSLQVIVGVGAAMMLHQNLAFRALARSLVLFPYLLSTVVSVLAWQWLFNDLYGFFNGVLMHWELIEFPIDWLGSMPNAMITLILVGTWKYFPFVVIAVLARLQTIPLHMYEAAEIDGAGAWARFWDITIPHLRGVLVIVILLRGIWDFKEFDLIFLLTGGGPVISTQTLPLLVYKYAFPLFKMGMASAVAVCMFFVMLVFMLLYLRTYGRDSEDV